MSIILTQHADSPVQYRRFYIVHLDLYRCRQEELTNLKSPQDSESCFCDAIVFCNVAMKLMLIAICEFYLNCR